MLKILVAHGLKIAGWEHSQQEEFRRPLYLRHVIMMVCTRWSNRGWIWNLAPSFQNVFFLKNDFWQDWRCLPFPPPLLPSTQPLSFTGLLPPGEKELVGLLLCQPPAELESWDCFVVWVGVTVLNLRCLVYCSVFLDFLRNVHKKSCQISCELRRFICHHIWLIIWPWYKIQEWQ